MVKSTMSTCDEEGIRSGFKVKGVGEWMIVDSFDGFEGEALLAILGFKEGNFENKKGIMKR